jgi:hypothetical protein
VLAFSLTHVTFCAVSRGLSATLPADVVGVAHSGTGHRHTMPPGGLDADNVEKPPGEPSRLPQVLASAQTWRGSGGSPAPRLR